MNERNLIGALGTSMVIHLGLLPVIALIMHAKPSATIMVPIDLVDVPQVATAKKPEVVPAPKPPPLKPRAEKITAPKLLTKPTILDTPPIAPPDSARAPIKEPEKTPAEAPKIASLPESAGGVKAGLSKSGEVEGSAAGAGNLSGRGDVAVVGGSGTAGGGGGRGNTGLGQGAKGDGGGGSGDAVTGIARPLGGYQVRPRYPESARRAGAQGTTLLKLRVLENGRVGEVLIEQSAGHRDLDNAAAEAVKKWLFEPARQGKDPLAVWVILPVKFELQR